MQQWLSSELSCITASFNIPYKADLFGLEVNTVCNTGYSFKEIAICTIDYCWKTMPDDIFTFTVEGMTSYKVLLSEQFCHQTPRMRKMADLGSGCMVTNGGQ